MLSRIGIFFSWVGAFLLFLFFISDYGRRPEYMLLFVGLFVFLLGLLMWRRFRPPPQANRRFRAVRNLFAHRSHEKEDNE